MPQNSTFLDRLIERLDRLDPSSVQSYVQRLLHEKDFLETVFNTIHEGILVVDRDLHIQYANQAAWDLLGLPDRVDNEPLSRFVRDIDWHGVMPNPDAQQASPTFHEVEIFYPVRRILTCYVVPHAPGENGNLDKFTLILQDVTALRQSTEKEIESQKVEAITQLAAGVAHEIGNPLNSLTIHLQLLSRTLANSSDTDTKEEACELLDVALHEVSRLDSITNEFLRAVRPTQPEMAPVQIQNMLAESIRFMRREFEDRNIRVQASLPDKVPMIRGDSAQLKQVFYNILKNALQATGPNGFIDIDCTAGTEFIEIRFTDNGKGISSDDFRRIMTPYFSTRAGGTGLGLVIVERIVRAHNGEVSIESEEGKGTTVSVRLPLRERQARLLQPAQQTSSDRETP